MASEFTLVFANPSDRICVLNVVIKNKSLCLIGLYATNDHVERPIFRYLEPFLMTSLDSFRGRLECRS